MSSPQKPRFRILLGLEKENRQLKLGSYIGSDRKTIHIEKPISVIGEVEEREPNGDYKIRLLQLNGNGVFVPTTIVNTYSAAFMAKYAKPLI